MDNEAVGSCRNGGEIDLGCKAAGMAQHYISVARTIARVGRTVAACRTDEEVVETVTVDIACRRDRTPRPVVRLLSVDDKAAVASCNGGEIDLDRKATRVAEHD